MTYIYFFGIRPDIQEKEYSDIYFQNLNLRLSGIVEEKQIVTNDAGMIYINVLKSNIHSYDIRNSGKYYYCVIKDNKAEIIEGGLSSIEIGDSIIIDSYSKSFSVYRNGKLVEESALYVRTAGSLLNKVEKLHHL